MRQKSFLNTILVLMISRSVSAIEAGFTRANPEILFSPNQAESAASSETETEPPPPPPYQSFSIVLYQTFFNTLTVEFLGPIIDNLTSVNLDFFDVVDPDPIDLDIVSFEYNMTDFKFIEASYDVSVPLIDIQYDYFNFSIPALNLTL